MKGEKYFYVLMAWDEVTWLSSTAVSLKDPSGAPVPAIFDLGFMAEDY